MERERVDAGSQHVLLRHMTQFSLSLSLRRLLTYPHTPPPSLLSISLLLWSVCSLSSAPSFVADLMEFICIRCNAASLGRSKKAKTEKTNQRKKNTFMSILQRNTPADHTTFSSVVLLQIFHFIFSALYFSISLPFSLFIHLTIAVLIHFSTDPSIHSSAYAVTHPSLYPSLHPCINPQPSLIPISVIHSFILPFLPQ